MWRPKMAKLVSGLIMMSYAIDRTVAIDGVSSQRIVLSGQTDEWLGVRQTGFEVVGGKECVGYAWIKAESANQAAAFVLETTYGATLARVEVALH